ncbi:MAG: hypothetical protein M1829_003566 [Trizodia sp. TS-e1964]|nr:MAG: hypothetical protein M1829_003566 [Trizodia sp. TS-e1964]
MNIPGGESASKDESTVKSDPLYLRDTTGYLPIENYGLIGNMRTCALVGIDGGLDYMCWPEFDSPTVFCRLLDHEKGGHFSICPTRGSNPTTKQQYLPSSNLLQTRYIHEEGVVNLIDFFPRPKVASNHNTPVDRLKKWLVRRVECIRGSVRLEVEIFPAFNYARDTHSVEIVATENEDSHRVLFKSGSQALQLDVHIDHGDEDKRCPIIVFKPEKREKMLGQGVTASILLHEGNAISFILRDHKPEEKDLELTKQAIDLVQHETQSFWFHWISKNKFKGRWREVVARSLLILKLLIYEVSGAIIASPTFSLPEEIGGVRNWDYRYCWVRDSSFTIYILLRMGFTEEAEAYMNFISDRFRYSRGPDGALPIMFGIHGETDLPEIELSHLEGYRGSKPVRIGNGAAFHIQLDIYGEIMDAIYLYNKYGKPVSWDQWVAVREIIDYISTIWQDTDMSIWEVRGQKQNFVYSKIMLWVAFDRGLRLADKRCLPCPNRQEWMRIRDQIYEDVMTKGYNLEMKSFIQSYEANDKLDSAVLIAPLVFFISPCDPRFLSTMDRILKAPEKGGLTSTGLVYRYNTELSDDGVGGREGSFSICTFWLVEALTRAGAYEKHYLVRAINIFENMLSFGNHLSMFSEEIAASGEQLGNTPQAFSHLALISAAFNLDRTMEGQKGGGR